MAEYELLDILQVRNLFINAVINPSADVIEVPHREWMTFFANIKDKVLLRSGLYSLHQRQFVQALRKRYNTKQYVPLLAEYFLEQPMVERIAYELPYLWKKAENWTSLRDTLVQLDLIKLLFNDRGIYST